MDDERRLRTLLPATGAGAGAVLVLVLAGFVFSGESPLEVGRRPGAPFHEGLRGEGVVEARLWQDPIRALSDSLSPETAGLRPETAGHEAAIWSPDVATRGKWIVLGATVPTGPSSESSEDRIRQRTATVSALALRGFVPAEDGKLRVHSVESKKETHYAYEWFVRDPFDPGPGHEALAVAVVWLHEREQFEVGHAVNSLQLFEQRMIAERASHQVPVKAEDVSSVLLGPPSSWGMKSVVDFALGPGGETPATERSEREVPFADLQARVVSLLVALMVADSDPNWERVVSARWLDLVEEVLPTLRTSELPDGERIELLVNSLATQAYLYLDAELDVDTQQRIRSLAAGADQGDAGGSEVRQSGEGEPSSEPAGEPENAPEVAMGLAEDGAPPAALGAATGDGELARPDLAMRALLEVLRKLVRADSVLVGREAPHVSDDPIAIYSSRATAPVRLLLGADQFQRGQRHALELGRALAFEGPRLRAQGRRPQQDARRSLTRTVASDEQLVELLIEELDRRGVDVVGDSQSHVALVGEWDSLYGRSLPFLFEAAVQERRNDDLGLPPEALFGLRLSDWGKPPARILRYSYLRGLDGVAPTTPAADLPKPATASAATDAATVSQLLERHEGPAQLDAIRRLGHQMSSKDDELRLRGDGQIRAIGVLGSDFYDKQLALQVLRDRFPRAVFFTTDLDARYLEPRHYRWNHNLVVASSYGLQLHPRLQCHVPPFRDSYSVASFLAVLTALSDLEAVANRPDRPEDEESCWPVVTNDDLDVALTPRLFEIGRQGAVDLSPDRSGSVHPRRKTHRREAIRLLLVVTPLVAALGYALSAPLARLWIARRRRLVKKARGRPRVGETGLRWMVGGGFALAVLALGVLAIQQSLRNGEPLGLFDGISLWPAEGVRLIAIGVGLLLLARAVWRVRENDAVLAPRFTRGVLRGDVAEVPATAPRRWPRSLRRAWQGIAANLFPDEPGLLSWRRVLHERQQRAKRIGAESRSDATAIWKQYRRLSRTPRWVGRVALYTMAAMGAVLFLLWAFGYPSVPFRGQALRWLDYALNWTSVAVLLVLTFYVWDVTFLTSSWVDALSGERAKWPANRVNRSLLAQLGVRIAPQPVGTEPSEPSAEPPPRSEEGVVSEECVEYLNVRAIADRTDAIGGLILLPFAMLVLVMLSRSRLFDDLNWPWSLLGIVTLLLAIALGSAVVLRREAIRARERAIGRLELARLQRIGGTPDRSGQLEVRQIELLIEHLRGLDRGAFAPWTSNPVIGALLIPFGGAGLAAVLEAIARIGV